MTNKNVKIFDISDVIEVVKILKGGGTAIFPTETSYGLGCDATNQAAVDKIFQIKGRAGDKPLLVVVPDVATATKYLKWNDLLDDLSNKFWEKDAGALTVVGEYVGRGDDLSLALSLKGEGSGVFSPPFKEGRGEVGQRIIGNKDTLLFRRDLRQELTRAEKILWNHLKAGHLGGLKIRRQHGIGPYIVDFYHSGSKIIIELDGDVHFSDEKQVIKDAKRSDYFNKFGYRIIRINNIDVFNNLDDVLSHLYFNLTSTMTSPCALSLKGEGKMAVGDLSLALSLKGEGKAIAVSSPFKERRGEVVYKLANGVVAKNNTVAVRVTHYPFLKSLTQKLGRPLVATSANLAGAGEIYDAKEAIKVFAQAKVAPDGIVDAGILPKNSPSTIVSAVGNKLNILRQGQIKII